jgi:hypothetical protein
VRVRDAKQVGRYISTKLNKRQRRKRRRSISVISVISCSFNPPAAVFHVIRAKEMAILATHPTESGSGLAKAAGKAILGWRAIDFPACGPKKTARIPLASR